MKSADLQRAVYARLNDVSLTSLLSSQYDGVAIFSDVPQFVDSERDNAFPYVVIAGDVISPYDTKDAIGGSAIVQIDIYGRSTSKLGTRVVADAVDARMRRTPLLISGVNHITTELETSTPFSDPDGKTYRVLTLYRVLWLA